MSKENYELLNVDENASDEEVKEAYRTLKKKYNEDMWLDGEAGTNAAQMIAKLDAAYEDIMSERRTRGTATDGDNAFAEVSAAIRKGEISRAQTLLDGFNERNAEWHYLQSVVYYKKNWMNESKKQLEIALQMDGGNAKYKEAYEKLSARADYKAETGGATGTNPNPDSGDSQMGGSWCANCANACYTCLCIN
ncbi:MAG: DnaJ domain-containing protein, partial [Clostridiales bacterium]|nr:DnaJ domain-containing protein [Clostridiales bacterium]